MPAKHYLGEFEQLLLLAILQLRENAYAPNISHVLEEKALRSMLHSIASSENGLWSGRSRRRPRGAEAIAGACSRSPRGGSKRQRCHVRHC